MSGGHAVQECVSNKCSAALGKVDEEPLVTMVARSALRDEAAQKNEKINK